MKVKIFFLFLTLVGIYFPAYSFFFTDGEGNEFICGDDYETNGAYAELYELKTPILTVPSVVVDTIVKYNMDGMPIVMPIEYNVTSFSARGHKSLVSVALPPSVKKIRINSFTSCELLTSVSMPGVVEIDGFAFSGCKSLTNISMPLVEYIGQCAFTNCVSLTSVYMSKCKTLYYDAFRGCISLSDVYMPNVLDIYDRAFKDCESLKTVHMPNVITIRNDAFRCCESLAKVNMSNAMYIRDGAFYGCDSLTNAYIPNAIDIAKDSFRGCSSLKKIYISNALKIGYYAFAGCNLESIIIDNVNPPSADYKSFLWLIYETAELVVPSQAIETYKTTDPWSSFYNMNILMENYAYTDFFRSEILRDYKVSGVTADGKTQLIVMTKDFDPNLSLNDYSVVTKIDEEIINDKSLTGEIGKLRDVRSDDEIGFIYTAPNGYAGAKNTDSYVLDIELISKNGKPKLNASVEIWRPGVLLLHGLNSDLTCWKDASGFLLGSGAYNSSQVVNYSYKDSNRASFDENTHKYRVVDKGISTLYARLLSDGILSSKYDLIGHSMGGILARKYAQEVNTGAVNRIITFNTPHSGSQLSDIVEYLIKRLSLHYPVAAKVINILKGQALPDLSINSQAIKTLNENDKLTVADGIPVHAACTAFEGIGSTMNIFCHVLNSNALPLWLLRFMNKDINVNPKYESDLDLLNKCLQDDQHDGIVSLISQQGGLSIGTNASLLKDEYAGILGFSSNAHHCNMTKWNKNNERLVNLLLASKDDLCFAKSFSPVNLGKNIVRLPANKERASVESTVNGISESSMKISLERPNEDSREVIVRISSTDDVVTKGAFCVIDEDRIILNDYEAESTFSIPYDYVGTLEFIALGYTEEGEWLTDCASLEFNTVVSPSYIRIESSDPLKVLSEESVELPVLAFWQDGESTIVPADFKIIDGEGVVNIVDGVLTGMSEGECTVEASYRDMTHTITVAVQKTSAVEAGVKGIMASADSRMIMFRRNSTLVVKLSEYYEGSLQYKAYSLDGRLMSMDRVDGMFAQGEEITFDLPKCNDEVIIVTCTRDDEKQGVMKISN